MLRKRARRERARAGRAGGPLPIPPARICLRPSLVVLIAGLASGVTAVAAGAEVAGGVVWSASLVAGLLTYMIEERQEALGRRCRVCDIRDDSDLTGHGDLRMWVREDLCLPCATDGLEAAERRCRACGCTDPRACVEMDIATGDCVPCHWVAADLCSACAPDWDEGWGL